MEQRDIIRWFKKGWVYTLITAGISILANFLLKLLSVQAIIDKIVANPLDWSGVFALGLLTLVWGIIVFPVIGGFLVEEVDKRIRR